MNRRKYETGTCADCGYRKRTTLITFWATGLRYRVCAKCIKPYRRTILLPS